MDTPPPQAALLARLETYPLPPGLAGRLAAQQDWTVGFTARVLAEYRRFLYLTSLSPLPVKPSRPVELAWHAHQALFLYDWTRLHVEVLRQPLHRNGAESTRPEAPSAAGPGADAAVYLRTLDLYIQAFGTRPPHEFWPDLQTAEVEPVAGLGRAGWNSTMLAFAGVGIVGTVWRLINPGSSGLLDLVSLLYLLFLTLILLTGLRWTWGGLARGLVVGTALVVGMVMGSS